MVAAHNIRPMMRYALGSTIIMGLATSFGNELAYVIPLLSLPFLAPGMKPPTRYDGLVFLGLVVVSTTTGLLFVHFFYEFTWFYLPVLAVILFLIYYTARLTLPVKIFLLLSFLTMPVPMYNMDPSTWASAILMTLVAGSFFTLLMVLFVYALFPDKKDAPRYVAQQTAPAPTAEERFSRAVDIFLVTFPVVLAYIFFQWGNSLLILLYIVVLSMLPSGHKAGIAKLIGNILGGIITILFYELIVIVPNFLFFILLYLGTALFFGRKIFSEQRTLPVYKTAFSTLSLVIGEAILGGDQAGAEIGIRILEVFGSVVYVVGSFALLRMIKTSLRHRKQQRAKALSAIV